MTNHNSLVLSVGNGQVKDHLELHRFIVRPMRVNVGGRMNIWIFRNAQGTQKIFCHKWFDD